MSTSSPMTREEWLKACAPFAKESRASFVAVLATQRRWLTDKQALKVARKAFRKAMAQP